MSLKQQILQLLSEEKSITEVQKILKCSKAYVHSCKSLLSKFKDKEKHPQRISIIKLKCSNPKCGALFKIRTSRPNIYTSEVRKKWLCFTCKDKKRK